MGRERFNPGSAPEPAVGEEPVLKPDDSLRPARFENVVGQRAVVDRLRVLVNAAKYRGTALPHILLDGPPGLGKTTLATVLPREMDVDLRIASGPALRNPRDLMPYLTNLTERSVLFIDEIHRMPRPVEEFIYPAMEDFRIDIVLGEGLGARTLSMPIKRFTLIGATTRSGMLSAPMRDRFVHQEHLDFYEPDDLIRILTTNAGKLNMPIEPTAALELAKRSRGTPRIANSHLCWVRDFATSRRLDCITLELAQEALLVKEVDHEGLDTQDRKYLDTLARVFDGGPAGVEAIAATMNLPTDTLSEEIEPFLLRQEFIIRTPRGRRATVKAYAHIGQTPPDPAADGMLF